MMEEKSVLDLVEGVEVMSKVWGYSPGYLKNLCARGIVSAKKISGRWVIDATQPKPNLYEKNSKK